MSHYCIVQSVIETENNISAVIYLLIDFQGEIFLDVIECHFVVQQKWVISVISFGCSLEKCMYNKQRSSFIRNSREKRDAEKCTHLSKSILDLDAKRFKPHNTVRYEVHTIHWNLGSIPAVPKWQIPQYSILFSILLLYLLYVSDIYQVCYLYNK